jgi:uncharacterized protein (TIGR00725 family)
MTAIAVLGSARLGSDDPAWALAADLGARLGAAGATVITGGYGGLMTAAGRAAAEAGGHVVGLPMRAWSHLEPHEWNAELRWAEGYPERLAELLACDAVVALDGGVGTLSELAVVWAAAQTEPGMPRLIALGGRWRALFDAFAASLVVGDDDLALVTVVTDAAAAASLALSPRPGAAPPGARG